MNLIDVIVYYKTYNERMAIPEKYCKPKYLVFIADVCIDALFVICPNKYGCRQFSNTFGRK